MHRMAVGDDALGRASGPDQQVGARLRSPGPAQSTRRGIQNAHGQIRIPRTSSPWPPYEGSPTPGGDVDSVGGVGPNGNLVHVRKLRRVEHRAALGDRQHRRSRSACPWPSMWCRRRGRRRSRSPGRARCRPLHRCRASALRPFSSSPDHDPAHDTEEVDAWRRRRRRRQLPCRRDPPSARRPWPPASVTRTNSSARLRSGRMYSVFTGAVMVRAFLVGRGLSGGPSRLLNPRVECELSRNAHHLGGFACPTV